MKYSDIAGKPVDEVLGMKVRFRNEETGRWNNAILHAVKKSYCQVLQEKNSLVAWVKYEDVEVIE